jgi:Protein of unknown function (DUF3000)
MAAQGMTPSTPPPFQRVLDLLHGILDGPPLRPELELEKMPAPQRLAPYAAALSASVYRDDAPARGKPTDDAASDEQEVGSGRLIVLYDPDGGSGWPGHFRIVAYIQADLDPEIAADELIGRVAWSWLVEALESAGYAGVSGTVTRAVSESFGDKSGDPDATELELRASWSPTGEDLTGHVAAWCDVLCMAAGLPPLGVSALPGRPSSSGL